MSSSGCDICDMFNGQKKEISVAFKCFVGSDRHKRSSQGQLYAVAHIYLGRTFFGIKEADRDNVMLLPIFT